MSGLSDWVKRKSFTSHPRTFTPPSPVLITSWHPGFSPSRRFWHIERKEIKPCSTPCDKSLTATTIVGEGGASLAAEIVKQNGPGRAGEAIGCIRVFIVNSENYADTLFNESVRVQDHTFHLQGFNASTVDIIIDREGFFPVKYVGVNLSNGFNRLEQRVLMYPSDVPFTIPGELGISLNEGATLDEIKPVISGIDGVSFQRSPGGSYELKVPFQGTRVTRERVERVCRNLVYSRHIADARPLVNLSTIVPGL